MKLVFDGDFGAAVAEAPGAKVLLITDKQGNEIQLYFTNEGAEIIGKALANTQIVIPQGHDVMELVKSRMDN